MKIYKVKYKVEQGGKLLPFHNTDIYTGTNPPKMGKQIALMTTPTTYLTVVAIDEINKPEVKESLTEISLNKIEKTRKEFIGQFKEYPEDNRKLFIDWYLKTHQGSYECLINDLSEYYLHISENRIRKILNE